MFYKYSVNDEQCHTMFMYVFVLCTCMFFMLCTCMFLSYVHVYFLLCTCMLTRFFWQEHTSCHIHRREDQIRESPPSNCTEVSWSENRHRAIVELYTDLGKLPLFRNKNRRIKWCVWGCGCVSGCVYVSVT